jgi:hypothetical protein
VIAHIDDEADLMTVLSRLSSRYSGLLGVSAAILRRTLEVAATEVFCHLRLEVLANSGAIKIKNEDQLHGRQESRERNAL